jgi:hypothetical protein
MLVLMQVQAPAPTDAQNMAQIKKMLKGKETNNTKALEDDLDESRPESWKDGPYFSTLCRVQDANDHWLVLNYWGYL